MWIDLFSEVSVSVNYWSCKRDWNISIRQKKIAKAKKTIKKNIVKNNRLEENSKIYMGIKKVLSLVEEESSFRWEKL